MKLVFRAQHRVQGLGDTRRRFLRSSTKAVKQARAGSLVSASLGVDLPLDLGQGVQTAERSDLPRGPEALLAQADPAVPFMELLGHVGAWSGAGSLRGELASRVVQDTAWPGSPGSPRAEKLTALSVSPDL